jgi:glycosyltransferase involved in cell wall biosynthesis
MSGRILHMNICLALISTGWGGAETVVFELARNLNRKGHAVTIVVNREMLSYFRQLHGVRLFDLGYLHLFTPMSLYSARLGEISFLRRLSWIVCWYFDEVYLHVHCGRIRREMGNLLLKNHIEIVHSHMIDDTFLISGLVPSRVPMVATVHGFPLRLHANILRTIFGSKRTSYRKALTKMDKVTAVSVFMSQALCEWEPHLKEKVIVIPNGVDVAEIRDSVDLTSTPRGDFNLLFPGGANIFKGGNLVIRALARLKSEIPYVHTYIAGDVPRNHPLRRLVREMRLESNTTFTGFLRPEKYRNLLRSVDVLVMPSREASFGIVYLEAMALGKPIVAGKTGAVPEVVKDGRNGILVQLDPEHIASALLRLYRNKDLAESMANTNLRDAMRFDWDPIVERYVKLYGDIMALKS